MIRIAISLPGIQNLLHLQNHAFGRPYLQVDAEFLAARLLHGFLEGSNLLASLELQLPKNHDTWRPSNVIYSANHIEEDTETPRMFVVVNGEES